MEYLEDIGENAILTPDLYQTDWIKVPTDSIFVACAMKAKAGNFIVTGEKHLKEFKQFCRIKIIDVKGFIEKVKRYGWSAPASVRLFY